MSRQALKSNLEELRAELSTATGLDPQTRSHLTELADEIEKVLEEPAPDYPSARARAEEATLRFEAEHPNFARILTEVTDALSKLGI